METEKTQSKWSVVTSFINRFLHNKRLVIFIGKNGVKIIAYNRDQIVNNMFSHCDNEAEIAACQEFLIAYKKFGVLILLDSPECQIKHEFMPMLHSIIKFNPAQKFIDDNYQPENIVAYNVYNIDHTNGEVWETVIASSPYTNITNKFIEFVISESFKLEGVYFLALEFEPIINTILMEKKVVDEDHSLQIFVTITQASGIKLATKHKKNILDETTVQFPSDKSDLYILGVMSSAIEDRLIKYKSYIHGLDLKVCLIFFCNKLIGDVILEKLPDLQKYEMVIYTTEAPALPDQSHHFQDHKLLELFMKHKTYLAANKLIKLITKLLTVNSVIFKPLLLILIGIVAVLGMLKYRTILVQKETIELNNKYYLLSEKYRSVKKRHPEVENINNLTDLYSLQKILSIETDTPCELLRKILLLQSEEVKFDNIHWYSENEDISNLAENRKALVIQVEYTDPKKDIKVATGVLSDYINQVKAIFKGYNVTYKIEYDKVTELIKTLTVPATITVEEF